MEKIMNVDLEITYYPSRSCRLVGKYCD